jgi:flagellar protein FlaG
MVVEAINAVGQQALHQGSKTTESIDKVRKDVQQDEPDLASVENISNDSESSVQPEELLSQIKAITEDGLYSVRFENSDEFNDELLVKIVDIKTDEVIRTVPAEELLGVRQALEDFRGNVINEVV